MNLAGLLLLQLHREIKCFFVQVAWGVLGKYCAWLRNCKRKLIWLWLHKNYKKHVLFIEQSILVAVFLFKLVQAGIFCLSQTKPVFCGLLCKVVFLSVIMNSVRFVSEHFLNKCLMCHSTEE